MYSERLSTRNTQFILLWEASYFFWLVGLAQTVWGVVGSSTGGCGKAEHLEKKKILGPNFFDFFGQIIYFGRLFTKKIV